MSDIDAKDIAKHKKELETIKKKVQFYQNEMKKELWLRNKNALIIFSKYILPYLVTFSTVISIFKLSNNGVPFLRDDIKKYKEYTLDYQSDEVIEKNSHYEKVIMQNGRYLKIYEPWKYNGENYERVVKEVLTFINPSNDLFEAIINEDIDLLSKSCTFVEKIEYSDSVDLENNDYVIDAKVSYFDTDDIIIVRETPLSNLVSTFMQLPIGFYFGNIISGKLKKDGRFTDEVVNLNNEYHRANYLFKTGIRKIKEKEELILSLEKGGNRHV